MDLSSKTLSKNILTFISAHMKIYYSPFFIFPICMFLLCSCGIPQEEHFKLKQELTQVLAELDSLKSERQNKQVNIANSSIHEISSKNVDQVYQIKVSYPKGYKESDQKYPVLYVLDAEVNFAAVSYIVQRLIKDGLIPEMLVIGIAYATDYDTFYSLRSRDLTPTYLRTTRVGNRLATDPTGGAKEFALFLSDELFPLMEETYRIDPANRGIFGHSYGGLFGTYVLLNRPEMFQKYLLLSPSLWYDNRLMLSEVLKKEPKFSKTKLYMGSGELEGRIDDMQEEFIRSLRRKKPANLTFRSEVLNNETHRTIFGRGLTNGLRYLYKD